MKIVSSTSEIVNQEIDATITDAINLGIITFWALIIFCTFACMMADWVLSKPWLGTVGLLTACLSLIGSFGIMGYAGIPFAVLAGATPFLIIGRHMHIHTVSFVIQACFKFDRIFDPVTQSLS